MVDYYLEVKKMIFSGAGSKKGKAPTEGEFPFHYKYSNFGDKNDQSIEENKFLYYLGEFIFHYILFIKKIEIFVIDTLKKTWEVLSSKEALRVYSIIGQILLFSLVLSAIFLLIFGQDNRGTRRRRRY
jgi:hypothetical protein